MLLQQLITFCKVAEAQSFSRAAMALNLSQPAVTRHVKSLEEALGARLLDRNSKTLHLTHWGAITYEHARRITEQVQSLRRSLEQAGPPLEVRVGLGSDLSPCLTELPEAITEFYRAVPGSKLVLRTGPPTQILQMVLDDAVDLGLVASPVPHPDVAAQPLFYDEIIFIAPPGHPLAAGEGIPLSELNGSTAWPLVGRRGGMGGWIENAQRCRHG